MEPTSTLPHGGTFKVEGMTVSRTYTLTWVNGKLEIDPFLIKALDHAGLEIVLKTANPN